VVLGVTAFAFALGLGVAATPGADVQAEAPAPASALARVGQKNAAANAVAAERIRREGPSAL
jgi:hypothetical protein